MVSPRRHWTGAGALVFVAVRDARRARRLRPLAPLRAPVGRRRSCDAVRRLQLADKCGSVRSNGYALRGAHPRECLYLFVRARSNASFTVWVVRRIGGGGFFLAFPRDLGGRRRGWCSCY